MGKIKWEKPRERLKAVFGGRGTAKPAVSRRSSADSLDRRNGVERGIVFNGEMCYTWINKLTDKLEFVSEVCYGKITLYMWKDWLW